MPFLSSAFLFCLALLARLAALGRYVTPDELNWVYRSLGLRRALLAGNWANTIQSGHPGVTTTWIGAASAQVQLWLQPELQSRLVWLDRLQQLSADNVQAFRQLYAFLDGGRLALALVTSLGLVLAFHLARGHVGLPAAFLGAALLALDPFFAGLSGLLHVDGLLALFLLLAFLLALRAQGGEFWATAGAGVCTALAILTKTPGLILLALAPLMLLAPAFSRRQTAATPAAALRMHDRLKQILIWAAALAVTGVLLLPALWAAPRHVVETVSGLTGRLVVDAVRPTYFLGRTALDHGPLFYPLVLLFRLSPPALIGVALTLPGSFGRRKGSDDARWLLLYALLFTVGLTLAAKKFDRYALPVLVVLTFLAGWGLTQSHHFLFRHRRRLAVTAVLVQAAFLLSAWPHPLTASNWLLGGRQVASHVFPSGWGEDAGQAARTLTDRLDRPQEETLFTSSLTGTAPFFPGVIVRLRPVNLTRLQAQDYVLALPQDEVPAPLLADAPPVVAITVPVRGVGTALLRSGLTAGDLQLPSFSFDSQQIRFGSVLGLSGAGSVFLPWPEQTLVGLVWQRQAGPDLSRSYRLQLALVDERGQTWLQREMPLLNESDNAPADWEPGAAQTVFYATQLPATLAPGNYTWVVRLFDDQGRQQAVFTPSGAFAGVQHAVAQVMVTAPASQPAVDVMNRIDDDGPLVGHEPLPQTATAGAPLSLDFWWRSQSNSRSSLVLQIGGEQSTFTLQPEGWRQDQVYRIRPTWRLPPEVGAGRHGVSLRVYDEASGGLLGGPYALGEIEVEDRQPQTTLPPDVEPLQIEVGDLAFLQGVSLEVQESQLLVHVVWQAREATFENYTTFVHVREDGVVLAGNDRQPHPATSYWTEGEVIEETYALPRPAAGSYAVALGLYDAASGVRLPMRDADGQPLAGDQFLVSLEAP